MHAAAIILAAGSSSRMGRSKQQLEVRGEPLLTRTIKAVSGAGINRITVVLGAEEVAHRKMIDDLAVDIVANRKWDRGMGSSLKAGLLHVISTDPSAGAVVVLVCDQPLLKPENISRLVSAWREKGRPIIASRYSRVPGVPALFDKRYFGKLLELPDDEGAKKVILENPEDVIEVEFPGGEVDLDTPEDYEAFMDS